MRFSVTLFIFIQLVSSVVSYGQAEKPGAFTIARLKYGGGGDWYNDPSIIPNMLKFMQKNTNVEVANDEVRVGIMEESLFSFPVLFMTGHGRIKFTDDEVLRLRHYLSHGGFLYADDDYGMDKYFREQMKRVFPDKDLVEIPFSHELFHNHFQFANGAPKIHEHDGGPPRTFAIFHEGRMIVLYTFNTNISDGWADPDVHNDPEPVRTEAFKMGTNIFIYALMH